MFNFPCTTLLLYSPTFYFIYFCKLHSTTTAISRRIFMLLADEQTECHLSWCTWELSKSNDGLLFICETDYIRHKFKFSMVCKECWTHFYYKEKGFNTMVQQHIALRMRNYTLCCSLKALDWFSYPFTWLTPLVF